MNRTELERYIQETYSVEPEFPWEKYPTYTVYRHRGGQKWFALVMDVAGEKLGLSNVERLDILNVKCDPILLGSCLLEPGFFPAYHMNKENWITIALDGSVDAEQIKLLLERSFALTAPKRKRKIQKERL